MTQDDLGRLWHQVDAGIPLTREQAMLLILTLREAHACIEATTNAVRTLTNSVEELARR